MLSRRAINPIRRFRAENWTSNESMLDIGTRSLFNTDHDIFRESVRRFLKNRVKPFQNEWDDIGYVPRELWTDAGEMGLLGTNISDEVGGIGGDFLSTMIIAEELQYIANSSIGWSLHSGTFFEDF